MKRVAKGVLDGGLKTLACVTTRKNSVMQKTGIAQGSLPSANSVSHSREVLCKSVSARCA